MHLDHDHIAGGHTHVHEHSHTHEHTHDGVAHTHAHTHAHGHDHAHDHSHECSHDCHSCGSACSHTPMEELLALMIRHQDDLLARLNDEEKEIFLNKLEYDGMTVNALGTINDYMDYQEEKSFIRADIRILDDIGYDADFAEDIAREVSRGVYIYGDFKCHRSALWWPCHVPLWHRTDG